MAIALSRLRRLACVLLILLSARAVDGSTVIYRTDAELVMLSDRVVHGRVLRQRTERPDGPDGAIYTVSTLAVLEDFTGTAGNEIEVWELGGSFGGETMWVGGAVTYDAGSTVLVCLERGRFGLRSVAMSFSKFDVEPTPTADGSLDGRLRRNLADTSVLGAPALRSAELTLAEFRELTARLRGVTPRRNRSAALLEAEGGVQAGFTFLGPFRWTEADSGTPVNWYLNTSAPSPLTSGNGIAELQTALQAWTGPSTASIVLQYAGTTNQADADGPWGGIASTGTGVVTFEDPNNEITGSTLAVGGGFGFSGGAGGTVNGTSFGKFTRGYVIWQNAADLSASFKQTTNFARVMEHEIRTHHRSWPFRRGHHEHHAPVVLCIERAGRARDRTGRPRGPQLHLSLEQHAATAAGLQLHDLAGVQRNGSGRHDRHRQRDDAVRLRVDRGGLQYRPPSCRSRSGASGSGSGTVAYSVVANNTTSQRSGTIAIAGQTFTLTQTWRDVHLRDIADQRDAGYRGRQRDRDSDHEPLDVRVDGHDNGPLRHDHVGRERHGQRHGRLHGGGEQRRELPAGNADDWRPGPDRHAGRDGPGDVAGQAVAQLRGVLDRRGIGPGHGHPDRPPLAIRHGDRDAGPLHRACRGSPSHQRPVREAPR